MARTDDTKPLIGNCPMKSLKSDIWKNIGTFWTTRIEVGGLFFKMRPTGMGGYSASERMVSSTSVSVGISGEGSPTTDSESDESINNKSH